MKKKWWFAALAILALGGGIAITIPALQPPGPGVTKANFDRIEIGMDCGQVETILGRRPLACSVSGCGINTAYRWIGVDGSIANVRFLNGRVQSKEWTESTETIADKLRRWLHLPRN